MYFAALSPLSVIVIAGLIGVTGCAGNVGEPSPLRGVDKYALGVRAYRAGDQDGAIANLQEAIHENSSLRMPHSVLGDIYRVDRDYVHAAEQYEAATRLDPYTWTNHYNLGLCYQFLHRLEDSAAAYLRALNLEPNDLRTNMNLGLVYLALGQMHDAQKYLLRATEVDPKSAEAWINYGVGLDAVGRLSDAESVYRRSLELQTGSISAMQNLAANLVAQKKANEAIAVCEQLLLRLDTPLTRRRYADALAISKQFDAAMQQYDIALKRDPKYYPAMTGKALVLLSQYESGLELDEAQHAAAEDVLHESLQLNGDQPEAEAALKRLEAK